MSENLREFCLITISLAMILGQVWGDVRGGGGEDSWKARGGVFRHFQDVQFKTERYVSNLSQQYNKNLYLKMPYSPIASSNRVLRESILPLEVSKVSLSEKDMLSTSDSNVSRRKLHHVRTKRQLSIREAATPLSNRKAITRGHIKRIGRHNPQYVRVKDSLLNTLWLGNSRSYEQKRANAPLPRVRTGAAKSVRVKRSNQKVSKAKLGGNYVVRVKRQGQQALYHNYNLNSADNSYTFSYDTGWTPTGRSYRYETRSPNGNVEGEFGYVDPDGVARVTKYTADRRGYRTRSFIIPKQEAEEEELLIVGPIPPHLKDEHLANNPEAVIRSGPSLQDIGENFED